jgi:hypothetical protein
VDESGLLGKLEIIEDHLDEVRQIVRAMQLSDAQSRGELAAVVGKLDNAAVALASAAQSIQRTELSRDSSPSMPRWAIVLVGSLLAIIAALVGVKEVLPAVLKLFAGGI